MTHSKTGTLSRGLIVQLNNCALTWMDTSSAKFATTPLKKTSQSIPGFLWISTEEKISTTLDFNMLCLEAPHDLHQITGGQDQVDDSFELAATANTYQTFTRQI